MRMCGRPAVPNANATIVETVSSGVWKNCPGARKASPSLLCAGARAMTSKGFQLTRRRTSTVSTRTPAMSSTALMICTQVVAIMPPKRT
jgi:hypothetical protein